MDPKKPRIAVYDTKPYDREYLSKAAGVEDLDCGPMMSAWRQRLPSPRMEQERSECL